MVSELVVSLGYRCNFSCAHCCVSDKKETRLSREELELIPRTINEYKIKSLLFIGGEPTLYIPDINHILSKVRTDPEVRITTNGHFAKSRSAAESVLSSILRLSGVNLSYDSFHARFMPMAKVKALYSACKEKGLDLLVLSALRSPLDLVFVKKFQEVGKIQVKIQKLLPYGNAKKNNIGFRYPSFDKRVLSRYCPNKDRIIYLCGEGFTSCCSSLVFDCNSRRFFGPTLKGYLKSNFYKLISKKTFGEMRRDFKLDDLAFSPEHSSPCGICAFLFKNKYGAKL